MLERVQATRFDRLVSSGRTHPALLACERADGLNVESIAKFSSSCDGGVTALAYEAIGAMLAVDLHLPVPEPFLVDLEDAFIDSLPDEGLKAVIESSTLPTFGSAKLPPAFSTWPSEKGLPTDLLESASEIYAFDALIQNADRRPENPNCLCNGRTFAIFDHELAFMTTGVIGWQPPWLAGSLQWLKDTNRHVFSVPLRRRCGSLERLENAWGHLDDSRLAEYVAALPAEWAVANGAAVQAVDLIRAIRDNIKAAMAEVRRVMQ